MRPLKKKNHNCDFIVHSLAFVCPLYELFETWTSSAADIWLISAQVLINTSTAKATQWAMLLLTIIAFG